jgi:ABC-type antimicrobial peptide transport system permease subunit
VMLTLFGLVLGIAGALGFTQLLSSMLFNVGKYDPVTFAAVAGVLLAMALLACYFPARRAMRVNPIIALRYE